MIEEIIARREITQDQFIALATLDSTEFEFAMAGKFVAEKNNVTDAFALADWLYDPTKLHVEYKLENTGEAYRAVARYWRDRE